VKHLLKIFLFPCILAFLVSCSSTSMLKEAGSVNEIVESSLSFEDINSYLQKRSPGFLSEVCIIKSIVRNGYYIVVDYSGIDKEVFYYEESCGFVETGIGGLGSVFYFREVTLSQGEFLEVFRAGSMGTGYLYLYENNESLKLAYSIDDRYVIDLNMDFRSVKEASDMISNELLSKLHENEYVSQVYTNGSLNIEYDDYNSDGNTDIRLCGIRRTLVTKDESDDVPTVIAEEICSFTYLFDEEENDFIVTSN